MKAERTEGPCAPLFFAAVTMLALAAGIVAAQTVQRSDLQLCAELESAELKLACFEAIVEAGQKAVEQEAAVAETATQTSQPDTEVADAEAITTSPSPADTGDEVPVAAAEANPAKVQSDTATSAQAAGTQAAAPTPLPATMDDVVPAVAAEPQSTSVEPDTTTRPEVAATETGASTETFGQEHLDAPVVKKEEETIAATVTEVTKGGFDRLHFHLSNGQVWRQIESRYLPYPKKGEFDIEITRGMMGDYRMRIGDKGRMVAIRRVE